MCATITSFMRDNDIYAAHAIVSPQAARDPAFLPAAESAESVCRVVREEDDGVVVSGMKMLATGADPRRRNLDRKHPAARAGGEGRSRSPSPFPATRRASRFGRASRSAGRRVRIRGAAHLPFRRDRRDGDVRQRQGAVGARVRAQRSRPCRAGSISRPPRIPTATTIPTFDCW